MASWAEIGDYSRLVNTEGMEPRAYQIGIAASIAKGSNSLVILPTGLGKTLIAVLSIANTLSKGRKAILLAPTKPLSEQHHSSLANLLNVDKDAILLLTGSIARKRRTEVENNARVIAATPQTVANDLKSGRLSLDGFGLVVFDECHRAVGRYAYTYIADECKLRGIQLLGLTASPGSNRKRIEALLSTLGIENIEMRVSTDRDVAPYVMDKYTRVITVEKNEQMNRILGSLKPVIEEHLSKLYRYGLSPFKGFDSMPKGRLLQIGDNIGRLQAQGYKHMATFSYVYVLHLSHAYDLLSTEGFYPFISYLDSLREKEKKSRVLNSILNNPVVINSSISAREALRDGVDHPKIFKIIDLLSTELKGKTVMVFAQYRFAVKRIVELLGQYGIEASAFVGKKEGVTQASQREVIDRFRAGAFKVLVSTSIGEEGLDIPSVDAVIFYEPIPNEIRNIQRRGRAGRMKLGEVFILVTRGTRDEAYFMISRMRERRMHEVVESAMRELSRNSNKYNNVGQKLL